MVAWTQATGCTDRHVCTRAHTHTHTRLLTHSLTHPHTHSCTHAHTHSFSLSLFFSLSLSVSLYLSAVCLSLSQLQLALFLQSIFCRASCSFSYSCSLGQMSFCLDFREGCFFFVVVFVGGGGGLNICKKHDQF